MRGRGHCTAACATSFPPLLPPPCHNRQGSEMGKLIVSTVIGAYLLQAGIRQRPSSSLEAAAATIVGATTWNEIHHSCEQRPATASAGLTVNVSRKRDERVQRQCPPLLRLSKTTRVRSPNILIENVQTHMPVSI